MGHGLTAIIALSEGLAGKTDDPRVEDALHGINEIARESLTDTRKAVRALTEFDGTANGDDTHTQESDQHSWDDIRPILAHARSLGIVTVFTETGTRADDEAQADLCFDVTREAITNAIRHGQNVTHVNVAWNHTENAAVTAIIHNDGTSSLLGSPLRGELAAKRTEGSPVCKDTGTGLTRLTHRIESIGGTFEYGPDENGEWVVTAVIPSMDRNVNGKDPVS
ncbi:histidine kinase [Bifidobacterium scardovii]|nr:histidine kinase [Bifidobacterium scardovii]MDK6349022.1 histidine kinase [Bifidobacterium scardovii]